MGKCPLQWQMPGGLGPFSEVLAAPLALTTHSYVAFPALPAPHLLGAETSSTAACVLWRWTLRWNLGGKMLIRRPTTREGSRLGERERLRLLQHPQSFGQLGRGFGASPPGVKGQASPRPLTQSVGVGAQEDASSPRREGLTSGDAAAVSAVETDPKELTAPAISPSSKGDVSSPPCSPDL